MCGDSNQPVSFVSVWHGAFAFDRVRTHPWTMQQEHRHILQCQELWYFMTASGCWAHAPLPFPYGPWAHTAGALFVPVEACSGIFQCWKLLFAEMMRKGALVPGTVTMLQDIEHLLPVPTGWYS